MTINWAFITVLLLSITGGVTSMFFIAFERHIYRLTSSKFLVNLHIVVLLTFVVPFYKLLSVKDGSEFIFSTYDTVVFVKGSFKDVLYNELNILGIVGNVDIIWGIGVIVFLFISVLLYLKLQYDIQKRSFHISSDIWEVALETTCKKMEVYEEIYLLGNTTIKHPCTTGLKKKCIIIPTNVIENLSIEEIKMVLHHELMHIKRNDLSLKLFIIALNSLNWFNPLYYILKNNLNDWIEADCDEEVTRNFSSEERKTYLNILIKLLEIQKNAREKKKQYVLEFGGEFEFLKRRIYIIMDNKRKRNLSYKVLIASLTFCAIFTGSKVAKASDSGIHEIFSENITVINSEETKFITSADISTEVPALNVDNTLITENITNESFEEFSIEKDTSATYKLYLADGKYNVLEKLDNGETAKHQHNFIDVYLERHKKNSDGSCVTTLYEAVQCIICDRVWRGDKITAFTSGKCTH